MVKLQVGPADAVQVTVVVPTGKKEPEGGVHVTVPQVPVVVGAAYVVTAPHWLGSFDLVMFAGQVMVHGAAPQVIEQTKPEVTLMVSMVQPVADGIKLLGKERICAVAKRVARPSPRLSGSPAPGARR